MGEGGQPAETAKLAPPSSIYDTNTRRPSESPRPQRFMLLPRACAALHNECQSWAWRCASRCCCSVSWAQELVEKYMGCVGFKEVPVSPTAISLAAHHPPAPTMTLRAQTAVVSTLLIVCCCLLWRPVGCDPVARASLAASDSLPLPSPVAAPTPPAQPSTVTPAPGDRCVCACVCGARESLEMLHHQ